MARYSNDKENRTARHLQLAKDIWDKVEALGMRRAPVSEMGCTLSDLYMNLEEYRDFLDQFIETDIKDRQALGEVLVDIQVTLEDITWHANHVKRALKRVIAYCYEEGETPEKDSTN